MRAPTHALIEPTGEFNDARLGKFARALISLESDRFTTLSSILLVIDGMGYRAFPTSTRKVVNGVHAVVYHVIPTPVHVAS
jgi:hypothetical protein